MNLGINMSRRTLLALVGAGAVSTGILRSAAAQSNASPHTFPNGSELVWSAPWAMYEDNFGAINLLNSVALQGGNQGELVVGYYDAPLSIDEVTTTILTGIGLDPSLAPNVAGGEQKSVGSGGVEGPTTAYRVHVINADDEEWGLYIQLVDKLALTAFVAPVAGFALELASAQSLVMLDGVNLLAGVDGPKVQKDLESASTSSSGSQAVGGGEFTDESGFVQVKWTNDWTVVSQDGFGIELTNPAQTIVVGTQSYESGGRTWQQDAEETVAQFSYDQGAKAAVSEIVVTDSGFSFATDGDYGLRWIQATATDDPETFVLVVAAHIEATGAEVTALLKETQEAILVNGTPALSEIDQFIDTSAT